jgi:predicted ATPase/DNA-binding winged helix-turn-helix (wHTH) protein
LPNAASYLFGDFELSVRQRSLKRAGRSVRLGSRAMDVLIALVERAGELVTRDEIAARLWPGIFVEESNLRVHVSALRKALGGGEDGESHWIRTVAGRGYVFAVPVRRSSEARPARQAISAPLGRLIGREAAVETIAGQVAEKRFVTIVGPGGIGKTSVALSVAEGMAGDFADGVGFIDLAALEDPETAPGAFALALGLPVISETSPEALVRGLRRKRMLLVLDNCERLVDSAAAIAEAALRTAPGVCVLATSREPLGAEGEWQHRLPPLSLPVGDAKPSAADALKFAAVDLFVERASAVDGGFTLSDEDCGEVIEICRRLDGLPLAIELAAATTHMLGIRGLSAGLDDRLALLTGGRRTAQTRHQTLRAALDWSYDLLSGEEQRTLNRLAVVAAAFPLDLACAVGGDSDHPASEVPRILRSLVGKSLVSADARSREAEYRLLESTRAYALEKLDLSGERADATGRYADWCLAYFAPAAAASAEVESETWLTHYTPRLGDARAVLDWTFSGGGEGELGRRLTATLVPVWLHLGLSRECADWCAKAIAQDPKGGSEADELRIQHGFGIGHGFTYGQSDANRPPLLKALLIARRIGDHDYEMRSLWSLYSWEFNASRPVEALEFAQAFRDSARGANAEIERLVGERFCGSALHLGGRHSEARATLEGMLEAFTQNRSTTVRFQFDQVSIAQVYLAWIAWMQGRAGEAAGLSEAAIHRAYEVGHPRSLGYALAASGCLAVLNNDIEAATQASQRLVELGPAAALDQWAKLNEALRALIAVRTGAPSGLDDLWRALGPENWGATTYLTSYFLSELAKAEAATGSRGRALEVIDDAIACHHGSEDFWFAPECLRIKGEILAAGGDPGERDAGVASLQRALSAARSHAAHALEARVRASLDSLDPRGIRS